MSPGSLYASGLIAAGGIVGLLGIAIKVLETQGILPENSIAWGTKLSFIANNATLGNIIAVATFAMLAYSLFYYARKPLAGDKK